jgi:hypothetical protein
MERQKAETIGLSKFGAPEFVIVLDCIVSHESRGIR